MRPVSLVGDIMVYCDCLYGVSIYAGQLSQPHDRRVAGSHELPQLPRSDSLLLRDDHLATVRGTPRSQIRIKKPPGYPC